MLRTSTTRIVSLIAAVALAIPMLAAPATANEGFTIRNANEQFGAFTIPASQAEPYLPEGFQLAGFGDALPEGRTALGVLITEAEGPGENETSAMLWVVLVVEPTEEYRDPDAALHYIHVGGATTSQTVADAYSAWGVPRMPVGDLQLDAPDDLIASWHGDVSTGEGAITLGSTVPGSHPDDLAGGAVRIFGVEDGEITGGVDITGTDPWAGGAGTATLTNDGLIPFDIDGPGAGYHAWDFGEHFEAADLQ